MNFIALALTFTSAVHNPWVRGVALVVLLICLPRLLGIVYIPHTQVGIIEKIWSSKGSLREGQIIARSGEAGFQARFLRGGIHFGLYPWQYRIHKEPLVVVAEGKMAYLYARDGVPLEPVQTLGRNVDCNHFQDAIAFLEAGGQRGRQRGIVESSASEAGAPPSLAAMPDFNPNIDTIVVVSIQDGPTIGSGEIIAPEVKAVDGRDHNYFQDPEDFLE